MRWLGASMAGQHNKNAFKFLLQLMMLSQKHILGVKKVVWMVKRWFGVVLGVSTDPDRSYHFTKIFPFEVNLPFI